MAKTLKQIHDQFGFPFVAKQVDSDPANYWHNRPLRFTKDDGPEWMHSDEGSFINNWDGWEEVADEPAPALLEKAEPTIEELQTEIADHKETIKVMLEDIESQASEIIRLKARLTRLSDEKVKRERLLEHANTLRIVVANLCPHPSYKETEDPKFTTLRMAAKVFRDVQEVL